MYKNTVNLIGFLGNDAKVHTVNDRTFTTLSLATQTSYKDKKTQEYVAHTEWHKLVVFGKAAKFAGTLKKGAHIGVEGELRTREYIGKNDAKQREPQVVVKSILKLDRAEQSNADDAEYEEQEFATEDAAQ
jgi:single-strand DNA-binding protein